VYCADAQVAVTQNDTPDRNQEITPGWKTVYHYEFIRLNGAQGRDRTTDTAIFSQSTDRVISIDIETFARPDV
jgi:hypothetical protein